MKTVYQIRGYIAHSEQDDFQNGCIAPTYCEHLGSLDFTIKGNSFIDLIDQLKVTFCTSNDEDFTINACDELGRLDLQLMQIKPFHRSKVSPKSFELWKAGKKKLFLTDYSFQVERIEYEFDLSDCAHGRGFNL